MRRVGPTLPCERLSSWASQASRSAHFAELCDFVRAAEFDWLGAFGYSDQEGAKAHALDAKVPTREIERRRKS